MSTKITAYKANDGSLFEQEVDALRHNAEMALLLLFNGNIGLVNTVLDNSRIVHDVIKPLAEVGFQETQHEAMYSMINSYRPV